MYPQAFLITLSTSQSVVLVLDGAKRSCLAQANRRQPPAGSKVLAPLAHPWQGQSADEGLFDSSCFSSWVSNISSFTSPLSTFRAISTIWFAIALGTLIVLVLPRFHCGAGPLLPRLVSSVIWLLISNFFLDTSLPDKPIIKNLTQVLKLDTSLF